MRKSNAERRQPHKPTGFESIHFLVKEGSIGNFGQQRYSTRLANILLNPKVKQQALTKKSALRLGDGGR
jgi:hypothetical protein